MLDQLDTMLFITIFKLFVNDIFCNLIGKKNLHSAIDVFSVEGKQHLILNQSDCMLFGNSRRFVTKMFRDLDVS